MRTHFNCSILFLVCRMLFDLWSLSTSPEMPLPSLKIRGWHWRGTWKWHRTGGTEQHGINSGTYEDVITLAVKHLGIGIRPKPDNAFAMLACSLLQRKIGQNELQVILWKKKKKKKKISSRESLLESANRYMRSCFLLIWFCWLPLDLYFAVH